MSYADDLRHPRWQRLRLEIMQRDGFRCVACAGDTTTLNVHHSTSGGKPWEVPEAALETLCETCHASRHMPGDVDVTALDAAGLLAIIATSIESENAATTDAEAAYHGSKQEQAWNRYNDLLAEAAS